MASIKLVKSTLVLILCAILFGDHLVIEANAKECFHFRNMTGGIISSPNYPDLYKPNDECIWKFENAAGGEIKLVFNFFELERHDTCGYDYVAIYDGSSESDRLLGKFCGEVMPPPVMSTTYQMLVVFHSDGGTERRGFKATYTKEPNKRSIPEMIRSLPGLQDIKENLTQHFLKTRREETYSINKWGALITKTTITLFLNNPDFFLASGYGEEIAYELSLQLLSKLALKKTIPTTDLALYINALTVTCIEPKDFFGTDLVYELRQRVNSSNYTNPFFILTLCNAKDNMTMDDVLQLQQVYDAHFRPIWTDTQAMVVMALSCIRFRTNVSFDQVILDEMISELKQKQHKNGTVDNLMTTALVVQALIAAQNYESGFDVSAAIKFISQEVRRSYPNIQDIYYILPVLNLRSFVNISANHCPTRVETDLQIMSNLHENLSTRIEVQASIILGNDMYLTRTWKMKVPSNYSFYQVLESISQLEPSYKVQYSVSDGKPFVVGVANFHDDIEEGMFWFIYSKPLSSSESPKLIMQSPVDIPVKGSEELILWYRSGSWEKI